MSLKARGFMKSKMRASVKTGSEIVTSVPAGATTCGCNSKGKAQFRIRTDARAPVAVKLTVRGYAPKNGTSLQSIKRNWWKMEQELIEGEKAIGARYIRVQPPTITGVGNAARLTWTCMTHATMEQIFKFFPYATGFEQTEERVIITGTSNGNTQHERENQGGCVKRRDYSKGRNQPSGAYQVNGRYTANEVDRTDKHDSETFDGKRKYAGMLSPAKHETDL